MSTDKPVDPLVQSSRAIDINKTENPWRSVTRAGLRDNQGKMHAFAPTKNPAILEMNRRAAENRPKSDGMSQELAAAHHENNAGDYRVQDALRLGQSAMLEIKSRAINPLHVSEFCRRLDKVLGKFFGLSRVYLNKAADHAQFRSQMGLFILMRGEENRPFHDDLPVGWKRITSVQVPYMPEWGVPHLDSYGAITGWRFIGWRGHVLLNLILQGALTEEEAHLEFGVPPSHSSESYRRQLSAYRNRNSN